MAIDVVAGSCCFQEQGYQGYTSLEVKERINLISELTFYDFQVDLLCRIQLRSYILDACIAA